ncbi:MULTISPECIES: alpha/beta hydrolase [unclassified Devosia]|uniref:alpha/beta fold hydrolase n=1 Tax=unclassified Devosia TaxID=196773 RepID=UPI0015556B24|nr:MULTISPECIES: alpha/beta hydrolase [unclassified Devosia]
MRMIASSGGAQLASVAEGERLEGTILLVMGATASMVWWPQALVQALADAGFQVIRFDHRDTGASTTNPPGDIRYTIQELADDLVAILDAYGVRRAHLVGMSLGGYLAQIVALQHPERVATLALLSAEPLGMNYQGEGIAPALLEHFDTFGSVDWSDAAAVRRFMLRDAELCAGTAVPFDTDAASARIEQELSRTQSMASAFNHGSVGGELDPGLSAADLRLPLLVVHGSQDPVISLAAARTSAAAVPGAELIILPKRGHELLEMDMPEIAAAVVRNCARAS